MADGRRDRPKTPEASSQSEAVQAQRHIRLIRWVRRQWFDLHRPMDWIGRKVGESEDWVRGVCRGDIDGWVPWDEHFDTGRGGD